MFSRRVTYRKTEQKVDKSTISVHKVPKNPRTKSWRFHLGSTLVAIVRVDHSVPLSAAVTVAGAAWSGSFILKLELKNKVYRDAGFDLRFDIAPEIWTWKASRNTPPVSVASS
jgi:hypothetical protein